MPCRKYEAYTSHVPALEDRLAFRDSFAIIIGRDSTWARADSSRYLISDRKMLKIQYDGIHPDRNSWRSLTPGWKKKSQINRWTKNRNSVAYLPVDRKVLFEMNK